MPKRRTQRIEEVARELRIRCTSAYLRPGDPFPSTRRIASQYGVSYQTAHRIVADLCAEGLLERRRGSGTYLTGARRQLELVELIFHPRAKRPGSFGAFLLARLASGLAQERIAYRIQFAEKATGFEGNAHPVLWEADPGEIARATGHYWTLLNNRPEPGLAAAFCDSISVDDFSGGVAAGQVIRDTGRRSALIISGPQTDPRSRNRVAGLRQVFPDATILAADGWEIAPDSSIPREVASLAPAALFTANDRLAEGILGHFSAQGLAPPFTVGFDDAPIAARLGISTIAIPWAEIRASAIEMLKRRLAGDASTGRSIVLSPRAVRRTHHGIP